MFLTYQSASKKTIDKNVGKGKKPERKPAVETTFA